MIDEKDVNKYAGKQLRVLRNTGGFTQADVAREIGVSPQQLQKYERGENRMSLGRAMQFAEVFNVSVLVLCPETDAYRSYEPVPPPTVRFLRLLRSISPQHYDQVYAALKAIAKLSGAKPGDE